MTMLMMERIIAQDNDNKRTEQPQVCLVKNKRISEDSRDVDMCEKSDEEDLNVDVENDDTLCPVDLTRRQFTSFDMKTDSNSDYNDVKRADSVCSDISRSRSPRDGEDRSPVVQQSRRLAFSVENILDPNKFTNKSVFGNGLCYWKQVDGCRASPDFEEADAGMSLTFYIYTVTP